MPSLENEGILMAGSAATQEARPQLDQQEYAHSNRAFIRWGGERALEQAVEFETVEAYRQLTLDDFKGALREMLKTDSSGEFTECLDVDDKRSHKIVNDKIINEDGEYLEEMITRGSDVSAEMAEEFEEFEGQADRDFGDVITIQKVEQLEVGQAHFAVSMAALGSLKEYPATYKALGYGDLTYIQWAARVDKDTVVTGSYSVDKTDKAAWIALMAKFDVKIPTDVDPNKFSRYSFERTATPEEAEQIVFDIRDNYHASQGISGERFSISEYVAMNEAKINSLFDAYYPHLADAAFSGKNNQVMREFAQSVLSRDIKRLKPEVRQELIKIANSHEFTDESAKTMDSLIRYAVVEELRKGLKSFTNKFVDWNHKSIHSTKSVHVGEINYTNQLLTWNLETGINAGRGYGGCPGNVEIGDDEDSISMSMNSNLQGAFGGNSTGRRFGREKWKIGKGRCVINSCPTRPGEVKIGPCGVCMDRCQKIYDKGGDPAKGSSTSRNVASVTLKQSGVKPSTSIWANTTSPAKVSYNQLRN